MTTRRQFFKYGALAAGGAILAAQPIAVANKRHSMTPNPSSLRLRFYPWELQLRHQFSVAGNTRKSTPVVMTEIEYDGITGYGEASMPPYLGETQQSVITFLSKLDIGQFNDPFLTEDILAYVDSVAPGNYAAKAAIDIALHDLAGKLLNAPAFRILGLNPSKTPLTSFTIGIDTAEMIRKKVDEAAAYKILKVKLGRDNDREIIETIRSVTDKPIYVDVNQGWSDRQAALDMIHWLAGKGVLLVEQPMSKYDIDSHAWLTANCPIPIIADEAVQIPADVFKLRGAYSGINIKLMKCGGIRNANKMISIARESQMKVMIGCMTETSCAVSAAAQLSPLVDFADLDGNLLISNDLFDGATVTDGRITLPHRNGIGVEKILK
jgi:L-alanine-DL-glutamate epimerase-like enolase superfamily enzyme